MPLGSARGGRKPRLPLEIEVVRELTDGEMRELEEGVAVPCAPGTTLKDLRHGHHMLAQALAKGMRPGEAALVTGYSSSRISVLQTDPAFKELLAHYRDLGEARFVDVMARMKSLGLSSMEELQARLDENPGEFSRRELMEMAELMLIKGQQGAGGGSSGGAGVAIQVKFVSGSSAPMIEGTVE